MSAQRTDFTLAALYAALDQQRRTRGLTWSQVIREIGSRSGCAPAHAISRSTVMNLRTGSAAEADGVLQMLRWLNRTPESFMPGFQVIGSSYALPLVSRDQILRFDTKKLHAALDAQRGERRMTWRQVATEIGGVSVSSLTRLKMGGRTSFPSVMRIVAWLNRPASTFIRVRVY